MTAIEYRAWAPESAEMRAEGDGMSFTGYAIRYGVKSEPLPFREVIAPGAVTRSLRSRNEIKAFVNHDTNLVLGSTRAGTLRLAEDERGVRSDIDLPDTTYGRDLSISVKRGDVSGMSFGFSVVKDKWSEDYSERTIHELRLHEVSVVTGFPAYTQTSAAVRALPLLAQRTGVDIDALAEAFDALSAGTLDNDQAALLAEAVDRARPEAPAAEPEPVDLSALQALSDLLKKRDDI
jgi:HK97 family phage prohead protease